MTPEDLPDPIAVAIDFCAVLEDLGIRYLIGGSIASSVHGEPRSTNDIDILADLGREAVLPFVQAVTPRYYVSEDAVREAIGTVGAFNAIHLSAAVKVDVFVAGVGRFNQERLRARERIRVSHDPDAWLYVDTAEHSVLRKLEWYRRGGEVSERQWRDVVAILRTQGERLDQERLLTWARHLGVGDLLQRALQEA